MKTIFIKDDRLREINKDLNEKIVEMSLSGKLKGSYTIKQATKKFKTKKYPFYEIYFGWEITDYEDGWKLKEKPKSGQEIQRERMRGHMGLTDTEGMTITKENLKKLMSDLSRSISVGGRIILGRMVYKDFTHFCSALLEKYFTKE